MSDMPKIYQVPVLLGDGSGEVMLDVIYIAGGFPRDAQSLCAFCHGDSCAEEKGKSRIKDYFKRNKWAETCPVCLGRAS